MVAKTCKNVNIEIVANYVNNANIGIVERGILHMHGTEFLSITIDGNHIYRYIACGTAYITHLKSRTFLQIIQLIVQFQVMCFKWYIAYDCELDHSIYGFE